jgi:ribosome biogenesis ATPase
VTERVVNQLLTELDGLDARRDVFVVAATNRPDIIDPAMLRPGRLDKLLYVPLPTHGERAAILATQTRRTPLAPDVDLPALARHPRAERFSGADLAGLVREASVCALKEFLAAATAAPPEDEGPTSAAAAVKELAALRVHRRHFLDALGRTFPSVSPADERLYNAMTARLRHSRSHLPTSAGAAAADAAKDGEEEGGGGVSEAGASSAAGGAR